MQNIIIVYFFYGLAFFILGLVLALASRQTSEFKFVQAIKPLAAFGILHGVHEWMEMFQIIAVLTKGRTTTLLENVAWLALLGISFVMLLAFGLILLSPPEIKGWRKYWPIFALVGAWAVTAVIVYLVLKPSPAEFMTQADVLIRYFLGIPGALLAAWASTCSAKVEW